MMAGKMLWMKKKVVDDMIFMGSKTILIDDFFTHMKNQFPIKNLGRIQQFLGLEASWTIHGLFLGQQKYAKDILKKVHMLDCKPIRSPIAIKFSTQEEGEKKFVDPTL